MLPFIVTLLLFNPIFQILTEVSGARLCVSAVELTHSLTHSVVREGRVGQRDFVTLMTTEFNGRNSQRRAPETSVILWNFGLVFIIKTKRSITVKGNIKFICIGRWEGRQESYPLFDYRGNIFHVLLFLICTVLMLHKTHPFVCMEVAASLQKRENSVSLV